MSCKFFRFLRFSVPVLLCFAFVLSFAPSASAASVSGAVPINYNQFVTNVVVDGANDLVTVSIPSSYFESSYSTPSWTPIYDWSGPEGSYNVGNQPNGLQIVVSPFGDRLRLASSGAFDGYFLSLKNIPSDATFSFDIQIEMYATSAETPRVTLSRYASNLVSGSVVAYNRLIQLPYSFGIMGDGFQYLSHVEGSFDTNYDGWYPIFNIVAYGVGGVVSTYLSDFDIKLSINSYYRALQESGLSDQIDDLRDELADQNLKLDDIISTQDQIVNGSVDSVVPDDSDVLKDLEDQEDELFGSVSVGFDVADSIFSSSSTFVTSLAPAFVFVASLCNDLWNFGPFGYLLEVSLALGIAASILGLGLGALRSRREPRFHGFTKAKKKGD